VQTPVVVSAPVTFVEHFMAEGACTRGGDAAVGESDNPAYPESGGEIISKR
jgi:hypothetical protein